MKLFATSLGLLLLGSTQLMGCAADSSKADCLPGDADCNDRPVGDGKADGYDDKNDPAVMSQHLEYHLDKLPAKGWRNEPAWKTTFPEAVGKAETIWADTYWPASEGSHNARWQGDMTKSPLEKYDAAADVRLGRQGPLGHVQQVRWPGREVANREL